MKVPRSCLWQTSRSIKLMGDSAYSVLELGLHANAHQVTLVTTGRVDAGLHELPPQRTRHPIGRPRVVGKRLPALQKVLQEPQTLWQKLTLDWYGQGERTLEISTGTALFWTRGQTRLLFSPWFFHGSPPPLSFITPF